MSKSRGNVPRRSRSSRPNTVAQAHVSAPTDFRRIAAVAPEDPAIEECPFDVTGYGKLLLRDRFKHKGKKVTVYLFQRIVVLTKFDKGRNAAYYLGSIKLDDLVLEPDTKPTRLTLRDFQKSRRSGTSVQYKLEAEDRETSEAWRETIQACLWNELLKAREEARRAES